MFFSTLKCFHISSVFLSVFISKIKTENSSNFMCEQTKSDSFKSLNPTKWREGTILQFVFVNVFFSLCFSVKWCEIVIYLSIFDCIWNFLHHKMKFFIYRRLKLPINIFSFQNYTYYIHLFLFYKVFSVFRVRTTFAIQKKKIIIFQKLCFIANI